MPEEIEKNHDKLQNSRYPGGDSNQLPSEYKSYSIPTSTVTLSRFFERMQRTRLKCTSTSFTWQQHQHLVPHITTDQIAILKKKRWVSLETRMDGWMNKQLTLLFIIDLPELFQILRSLYLVLHLHPVGSTYFTVPSVHFTWYTPVGGGILVVCLWKKYFLMPSMWKYLYRSVSFNNVVICVVRLPGYVNLTCVWCGLLQSLLPIFFVPLFCFEGLVTP
jgi:hypothetical protein